MNETNQTPSEKGPPSRIYLQWVGDSDDPPSPDDDIDPKDVSWCQDKIFEHDVEYQHIDSVAVPCRGCKALKHLAELVAENADHYADDYQEAESLRTELRGFAEAARMALACPCSAPATGEEWEVRVVDGLHFIMTSDDHIVAPCDSRPHQIVDAHNAALRAISKETK